MWFLFQVTWQWLRFRRRYLNCNVNFPYLFIVLESLTCLNKRRRCFHSLPFFSLTKDSFSLNENICVGYRSLATPEHTVELFWNNFHKNIFSLFKFFIHWKREKDFTLKRRFNSLIKLSFHFLLYSKCIQRLFAAVFNWLRWQWTR